MRQSTASQMVRRRLAEIELLLCVAACSSGRATPPVQEAQSVSGDSRAPARASADPPPPPTPPPPAPESRPVGRLPPARPLPPPSSSTPAILSVAIRAVGDGRPLPCGPSRSLSSIGACRPVPVQAVAASGSDPSAGAAAVDGDSCTVWNAGGFAPQVVSLDLGDRTILQGLLLVTETTPDGRTTVVIETSDDGDAFNPALLVDASIASQRAYVVPFPRPLEARHLRLRSTRSVSWIAWREVVPLSCDGPIAPADSLAGADDPRDRTDEPRAGTDDPLPRPPPRGRVTKGRGRCRTDEDCIPSRCCDAPTCVARATGPRCRGIGCPADCTPGTLDCGGRCTCVEGRCGAVITNPPPAERPHITFP